jgi:hypothetical protein
VVSNDVSDVVSGVVSKKSKVKRVKKTMKVASVLCVGGESSTSDPYSKQYTSDKSSREQRHQNRIDYCRGELNHIANLCVDVETECSHVPSAHQGQERAFLADWSNHQTGDMYWSFAGMSFIEVAAYNACVLDKPEYIGVCEEGFRAVTQDVPKDFTDALSHPVWGAPARTEWDTVVGAHCIVQTNTEMAIDCINNHQADLVVLFPVYESKVKDGVTVYKVRLVGDGRTHYHAGSTYAATPSREELLVLLHVIAALDWDYAHVDEIRAFLNADYKGDNRVFAKLRNDNRYFEVKKALYGLKSSPKDYQDVVAERLSSLGYKRLSMCNCIYILVENGKVCIVYDFVDDFIFTGNSRVFTECKIAELRAICSTTPPIWNAENVLGLKLRRDRAKRIICVSMEDKISELAVKYACVEGRAVYIPMPTNGFIIKDDEFELLGEKHSVLLDKKGIKEYLTVVGSLMWIAGIRLDIIFTVMYLSWFTKSPRAHNMEMAMYCVSYLYQSRDLPLVLGGRSDLQITAYTDASLGTASKGRSVLGHLVKLNSAAGAITAKASASQSVHTSSFEGELDGLSGTLKAVSRVNNILVELQSVFALVSDVYSDNEAMIEFVHGRGVAKGVRHMELRMWYIREKYSQGCVNLMYMEGVKIPADKLTKLGNRSSHEQFRSDIMGLCLLDDDE